MTATWDQILTAEDRAVLARGKWAQRAGVGQRPALIVVDAQYYMTGIRGASDNAEKYPLACGETAFPAVAAMRRVLLACRAAKVPIFFTRYVLDPVTDDVGMFHRKIGAGTGHGKNLYFKDTPGAEIVEDLKPLATEVVIDKKKFSAFFGTPLLSLLIDRRVDTCIVIGGSTSNCVRVTVVDSNQYNFFTIVPEEAVFDRLPISHRLTLFDIDRSYGDVVPVADVLAYIDGVGAPNATPAARRVPLCE